jgi:hypothetical protein
MPIPCHSPDGTNKEIRQSGKIRLPSPAPLGWNAAGNPQ